MPNFEVKYGPAYQRCQYIIEAPTLKAAQAKARADIQAGIPIQSVKVTTKPKTKRGQLQAAWGKPGTTITVDAEALAVLYNASVEYRFLLCSPQYAHRRVDEFDPLSKALKKFVPLKWGTEGDYLPF